MTKLYVCEGIRGIQKRKIRGKRCEFLKRNKPLFVEKYGGIQRRLTDRGYKNYMEHLKSQERLMDLSKKWLHTELTKEEKKEYKKLTIHKSLKFDPITKERI